MSDGAGVRSTGWKANAVRASDVQTFSERGREYLRFPLVPLVEMVYEYPENGTNEYLPAEHISETANAWDGTLLTYVHPDNRQQTVRDPNSFMGDVIGAFHDPELLDNGERLKGYGLIDVEKAQALGGHAERLVELLRNGEEVSVSAGYVTTENEYAPGHFDGDAYDLVQGPPLPDHIAIFPSDSEMQARCSPEDGCVAPRANALTTMDGQSANQRANCGNTKTMSNTKSNGGSTGFPNDMEREKAVRTLVQEVPDVATHVGRLDDNQLRELATIAGYSPDNVETNCSCHSGSNRSNSVRAGQSMQNLNPNMAAVAGPMHRNYDDTGQHRQSDDPEEYPSGGRKAWERRQVGLDESPDERPSGFASGRSNYEDAQNARAQTTQSADGESGSDSSSSTFGRDGYRSRQNATVGVDEKEYLTAEYPLTAKRKREEEKERERRRERLTDPSSRDALQIAKSRGALQ